ncbi:MAG TPA: PEP-CTERM sorting domain-containing protein [Isosphaeraceae bacterium]
MKRLTTIRAGRRGASSLAALMLLAALGSAAGRAEAGFYSITDLGNLGTSAPSIGPGTGAGPGFGGGGNINAGGMVTGYYSYSGGASGFVANGAPMTSVPSLGSNFSFAFGINASGQVVGISGTDAFLYDSSTQTLTDLTTTNHVTLGGFTTQANAINDGGQIAGQARNSGSTSQAFLYSGGTTTNLSNLANGATGYAEAINNSGQVTGQQAFAAGAHAFLYSGGSGAADTGGTMKDLGTIGHSTGASMGYDINASGLVVGESNVGNSSTYHAFLYDGTSMVDLFAASDYAGYNSQAFGMNSNGDIVGVYSGSSSTSFTGTQGYLDSYSNGVYTITDLNSLISPTSGWTITGAYGINDSGQIDVIANDGTSSHVLLLTAPLLVPEPPTIALLCSGAVVGLGLRRFSRRIKAEDLAAEPVAE